LSCLQNGVRRCLTAAGALDVEAGRLAQRWRTSLGHRCGHHDSLPGIVGYAQWSGHWHTTLPERTYFALIPNLSSFAHTEP
jgi:hypothetical protein